MSELIICEGCGLEFTPDEMGSETLVNLRDGKRRYIHFDGQTCCDFWDDTEPGDWVALDSGEEVQRAHWMCEVCCSVYDHDIINDRVDTEDESPIIVCWFCQQKEPERFKAKKKRKKA